MNAADLFAELEIQSRALADAQRIAHVGSFEWIVAEDRLRWSDELFRIFGVSPAEFEGNLAAYVQRLHPGDRERVWGVVEKAVAEGGRFDVEERIIRDDGAARVLETTGEAMTDESGRVVRVVGACRDVTEQRALEHALAWVERRSAALIERSPDVLTVIGADRLVLSVSPSIERHLGYQVHEVVGWSVLRFVHVEDVGRVSEAIAVATDTGEARTEYRVRGKDGRWRWFESIITDCAGDAVLRGMLISSRDVTSRKSAEEAMLHQSLHDQLTTLPNQVLLMDRLQQALSRRPSTGLGVAVVHADIDHFTWLNDVLGRGVGDLVLVAVAAKLQVAAGAAATVARVGADEFVAVLHEVTSAGMAQEMADAIAGHLATPTRAGDQTISVGTSIGVAFAGPHDQVDAATLLRDADTAVHWARERGPARAQLFDREIRAHRQVRMGLEQSLERAVARREFTVHYQPIVELASGRPVGFEALVRWVREDGVVMYPDEFVPVAEETGLVVAMGRQVLREAARQIGEWNRAQPDAAPFYVSVNLSPRQLLASDVTRVVRDAIADGDVDPSWLWLELTESALISDLDAAGGSVRGLKDLGVRLAIDDFGTGYSSLSYLKRFSVDAVKIDRSFVSSLGTSQRTVRVDESIVEGVINLADALGLSTIAEGVERTSQATVVARLGCNFGQGYLWAKPMPAVDVTSWLAGSAADPNRATGA